MTNLLSIPPHRHGIGKDGMKFHASRRSRGFTTDPAGFTTEKDSGKENSHWFDLPPATGALPYRLSLDSILTTEAMKKRNGNAQAIFMGKLHPIPDRLAIVDNIMVCQHNAFRKTGSA